MQTMLDAAKISVLVVDDHPLTRIGVCATINAQPDLEVIAGAGTTDEAVHAFRTLLPNVILMDLNLPTVGGVNAIKEIRKCHSETKIVVLTTYEGDEDIHQALKAGANGYVIKGMSHEVLLDAIRTVASGGLFLPPPIMKTLQRRTSDTTLRPREKEVLAKIVAGKSNKEIASDLGITEGTVKCHVSVIFIRLGVTDRTQAAMVALTRGLAHL
ncbi:MAG: response regulator transcription factor [Acidobacteriaceae bacterium]|nr:response regulator transcription factor [Acidobacteriaceae bacterium]